MEKQKNRHLAYMSTPTSSIKVLCMMDKTFKNDPSPLLHKIVSDYNTKIANDCQDYEDLEVFFTVLCYEYQYKHASRSIKTVSNHSHYTEDFFSNIIKILIKNPENGDEKSKTLLLDIVLLQIILYCNAESFNKFFRYLITSKKQFEKNNNEDGYLFFELIDVLVDTLNFNSDLKAEIKLNNIYSHLIQQMNSWFLTIEHSDWKLFVQIINKLLGVFEEQLVLPSMWNMILEYERDDWDKPLTLLCILINDILSSTSETVISLNIAYCNTKNRLWELITWGITSKVEQNRKQALYIMKNILDFIERNRTVPCEIKAVPFVYCSQYNEQPLLKEMKNNFFLILESLEEKQVHLITPALKHLDVLIQLHIDHLSCENCFNAKWLTCIFERVLEHKTNLIRKLGVMILLKIDPKIYDEQLFELLVKALNNMFLYNNPTLDSPPSIVEELANFFINSEKCEVDLIKKFICTASEFTWMAVPLYYVMLSIQIAGEEAVITHNAFTTRELKCVLKIIENNIKIQNSDFETMRVDILDSIYMALEIYMVLPIDLETLAQFLKHFRVDLRYCSSHAVNKYIKRYIRREDAMAYFTYNCNKLSTRETVDEVNVEVFSAALLGLCEAKILSSPQDVRQMLNDVFRVIMDADVRPYSDKYHCIKIVQLISDLLKMMDGAKDVTPIFHSVVMRYVEFIRRMILKHLQGANLQSYEEAKVFSDCFDTILYFHRELKTTYNINNVFGEAAFTFIDQYHQLGELKNIKYWYGLKIAALWIRYQPNINDSIFSPRCIDFFVRITREVLDTSGVDCDNRKIVAECYELSAELFENFIRSGYERIILIHPLNTWILHMNKFIEIGKEYVVISIINILQFLFKNHFDAISSAVNHSDNINSIIDCSFMYLKDMKRNPLYWSILSKILGFILNDTFFKIEKCKQLSIKHMNDIILQSRDSTKTKNLLLENIQNNSLTSIHYYQLIIFNFLDANLGENELKIKMQTYNHITIYSFVSDLNGYVDVDFRAKSIVLFMKILNKTNNHSVILTYLISVLKRYENKRYFENSSIHKTKLRVIQLLLLLYPYLNLAQKKELHDEVGGFIVTESNQCTVKILQEWLLIKIYLENAEMRPLLWELLERGKNVRPGSITSIVSIVHHVCRHLPIKEQKKYANIAMSKLLFGCLSQKYIVRLYCQVILAKLLETDALQSSDDCKIIKEALHESMNSGNLKQNSVKLSDEFYFTSFDPIKDYTLEAIFYDIPRLFNMSIDECIPEKKLRINNTDDDDDDEDYIPIIPLSNEESKLRKLAPSLQLSKSQSEEEEHSTENNAANDANSTHIQKKVIPGKLMSPIDEDLCRVSTLRQEKLKDDIGLIVVASLIDGMPNLGGLARTAEIFCVKELVLGSSKYIENQQFQTLSVSADKWITITEVKAHNLRNYLMEKGSTGWTVVGAEQTTNSVNLLEMKFDKKTILILGNEKSGIPADLIPLLDVCVEIPQAGVVRSLNVHVTGAICMWQYATQHIF